MGGSSSKAVPPISKASQAILEEVRANPVVIYTKHHCQYCVMAKNEMNEDGINYVEKNLNDLAEERPDIQDYVKGLTDLTKQRTVPQIFVCGKFVGGYTELHAKRENLTKMITECSTDGIVSDKKTVRPKL